MGPSQDKHETEPPQSPYDRHAYLVGLPIKHSISPTLHKTLYSRALHKNYGQIVRETTDLASHLKLMRSDPKCMGSGVTMPYKVAVIPLLDELTPEAQAIGAVNTIFFQAPDRQQSPTPSSLHGARSALQASSTARFIGTNTDCIGVRDAFLTNVASPKATLASRPGLVIGGGGTVRAAVYALHVSLGCTPIYIINRDDGEVRTVIAECAARGMSAEALIHVSTPEQAKSLEPPGAVVSCIPNFTPSTPGERNVREILTVFLDAGATTTTTNAAAPTGEEQNLKHRGALLEMCYHPTPRTEILELAEARGWQVMMGTEAMIGQGLEQARLWTGLEVDEELRREARKVVEEVVDGRRALV